MRHLLLLLLLLSGCETNRHKAPRPSSSFASATGQKAATLTPIRAPGVTERFRPLYALVVNEKKAKGSGMQLSVREVRRNSRTSLIRLEFGSGGSVPSIMTYMFALYRMALDRGARYFVLLQDGEEGAAIGEDEALVGFSPTRVWRVRRHFNVSGPMKEDIHFFSVKEVDELLSGPNPFVCE